MDVNNNSTALELANQAAEALRNAQRTDDVQKSSNLTTAELLAAAPTTADLLVSEQVGSASVKSAAPSQVIQT